MSDLLLTINWKLLRQQKLWLMRQPGGDAEGLLGLIDALQDKAEELGIKDVFEPYTDD